MAKSVTAQPAARLPRGSKPVSQAFFAALDSIPEGSRSAVAKAALSMIRDELKLQKEKAKAFVTKQKTTKPAVAKTLISKLKTSKAKLKPAASAPCS
jgi:hypothetical protein